MSPGPSQAHWFLHGAASRGRGNRLIKERPARPFSYRTGVLFTLRPTRSPSYSRSQLTALPLRVTTSARDIKRPLADRHIEPPNWETVCPCRTLPSTNAHADRRLIIGPATELISVLRTNYLSTTPDPPCPEASQRAAPRSSGTTVRPGDRCIFPIPLWQSAPRKALGGDSCQLVLTTKSKTAMGVVGQIVSIALNRRALRVSLKH